MYFGLSIGGSPAWSHGHNGGNMSSEPLTQLLPKSNCGNDVCPALLLSKYRKNTKNLETSVIKGISLILTKNPKHLLNSIY